MIGVSPYVETLLTAGIGLSRRWFEAAPGWRLGRIPDWLGDELPDLSTWHVLAAGSPGFVEACVAAARRLGAVSERILTDSFTPTIA